MAASNSCTGLNGLLLVFVRAKSPPRSPDSILKLCPPLHFFPSSLSSKSYLLTFDEDSRGEYHDQRRQLLSNSSPPPHCTLFETHLGSQSPLPVPLDSISRGPDGRFLIQLIDECSGSSRKEGVEQVTGGASDSGSHCTSARESPRSSVFSPESDERKDSPRTLDVSELHRPLPATRRVWTMASHYSRYGCFPSVHVVDSADLGPSDSSSTGFGPGPAEDVLPRSAPRRPMDSELTNNSTKISQLNSDLEGDSRDIATQWGQEAGEPRCGPTEPASHKMGSPERESVGSPEEPVWKPQQVTMRQKHMGYTSCVSDYRQACYFGNTSSPLDRPPSSSRIQWDLSPITAATRPVPVQSHQECCVEPTEVSFSGEASRSAVTQNTSLPALTPDGTSESSAPLLDVQTASSGLQKDAELLSEGTVPSSRHSYSGSQHWDSATRSPTGDAERPGSSAASYSPPNRSAGTEPTPTHPPGPAGSSTLPYDQHEVGARAKEFERERRSENIPFMSSPSPISSLTLVEEADPDPSQCSVPTMSSTFRAKPTGPSPKMSPQQTSAVLEYLSLPCFFEMSVDEPPEGTECLATPGSSENFPRTKPDVVPKNWLEENQELHSEHPPLFGQAASASHAASQQPHKRSGPARVRFPEELGPSSPSLEKTSKQLYSEKTQIQAPRKNLDRAEFRRSRSAQTLLSAAKGVADVVTKHSLSHFEGRESLLWQSRAQGSRVNNIASRIYQAPVPFLKKSFSAGPRREFSAMSPPQPFMRKSFSLGSQRWEHFESPRKYIYDRSYWNEVPSPNFRSYSYSHSQSSFPRPDPSWRDYVPLRPPDIGSLERPGHARRALAGSSYLTSSPFTPRQTSVSPLLEPADPRRQAAVFPESPRWSPSYQDMFRSAQHKHVPMPSSIPIPQQPHLPGPRAELLRSTNPRRGPPRSYLPRGVGCPSGYYVFVPPRQGDIYPQPDRVMRREGEMEGGRTSYASQSSGRGSASFFQQSLSVTPTLLSSPETTEDGEGLRAETEPRGRRKKR